MSIYYFQIFSKGENFLGLVGENLVLGKSKTTDVPKLLTSIQLMERLILEGTKVHE